MINFKSILNNGVINMKTGSIHHLEINVSNLENTVAFWSWFLKELGYEDFQTWEQGKSWRLADTYIVFVQTPEKYLHSHYHRSCVGLNHLAFHAESKEHVEHMTIQLQQRGINILYKDKHPFAGGKDHYAVFFEDPDRIKVELVAPRI